MHKDQEKRYQSQTFNNVLCKDHAFPFVFLTRNIIGFTIHDNIDDSSIHLKTTPKYTMMETTPIFIKPGQILRLSAPRVICP